MSTAIRTEVADHDRGVPITATVRRTAVDRVGIRQLEQVQLTVAEPQPGTGKPQVGPARVGLEAQHAGIEP